MASETIRGTVTRVFYSNPDSPSMAGVLQPDKGATVRFAGKCYADVGDVLEMVGGWVEHPKFGKQFEVETGLVKMDESPDALVHLLATHKDFSGLGPARARKLVDAAMALSEDGTAASALVQYPEEIAARSGVARDIVENAAEVWGERKSYFDALAQLTDQGWSSSQATRIVKTLGEGAPAITRGDPYMLIGKIPRFGFRTVDVVAQKIGFKQNDPLRLNAGVAYCLDRIADGGNTWTTRSALLSESLDELRPNTLDGESLIRAAIQALIEQGYIHVDASPLGTEIVSDSRLARVEVKVFELLLHGMSDTTGGKALNFNTETAAHACKTLNEGQAEAIAGFGSRRTVVISGAAGSGKTYAMKAAVRIAADSGLEVILCAPTGRAARKLQASTGWEAKTIHKTLEPRKDPETGEFMFTRHAGNLLDADMVIVDEASMIDVRLMLALLCALPSHCRILLVGDHNQIPSVGPGAILRDLLAARTKYPEAVHVLTELVRQAGTLARNITAVLDGVVVMQDCEAWGIQRTERGSESGSAAIGCMLIECLVTAPEPLQPFGRYLDLVWDIQVLSPMRKGPLGTWALNVHLQKLRQRLLGNPEPEATPDGRGPKPLVGDKVLWTKNDNELDLSNGTQAIVRSFGKAGSMVIQTEEGRDVTIPGKKRSNVEVAYAMTIHKSQGSEWPFVLAVASSSHYIMHDRNLLYTALSRASESVTILGDVAGMKSFAKSLRSESRKTLGGFAVHGWTPGTAELKPSVWG